MKTRYWVALLAAIMLVCAGFSIPLLIPDEDAAWAEIISDGQVMQVVDLNTDREIHITTDDGGKNTVTVRDGTIGVTAANCPDHHCMDRGMCSSGVQIVCLPNKLIIRFLGEQTVDSVAG
ncbi:MAG: NusG domain II-containing protein [Oscillospiraceae bacterium]|nr:NusG domain II-containing protein [Oscillospiraceae bacterium]